MVCIFVFLPLIYGFLGLADPFNVINYILVVPMYFSIGSNLVRKFYDRVYAAQTLDRRLSHAGPFIARLPADTISVPVLIALIVQLTYIYVDLGFGVVSTGGQAPFEAFAVLFRQHWISKEFPNVFFILYITIQFIALWFAVIVGIAAIDIIKWLIVFFGIRKSIFSSDNKYKEADIWIYNTNKSISGVPWLAMALSLNGFTYRAQIKNISTINYNGFMLLAIVLLILSVSIKTALLLIKEKYLSDNHEEGVEPKSIGALLSTFGLIISAIVRSLPSWGMLAAGLGIAANFPGLGNINRIKLLYGYISPVIESFFGFTHF